MYLSFKPAILTDARKLISTPAYLKPANKDELSSSGYSMWKWPKSRFAGIRPV